MSLILPTGGEDEGQLTLQVPPAKALHCPSSPPTPPGDLYTPSSPPHTSPLPHYMHAVFLYLMQVTDRPVSSCGGAQGPVCAPDTDLVLVKEMHAVFGAAPLLCVFCVSSLFPGLVDCSSEQHCTEVAAALAAELVGQSLHSNRSR